MKAQRLDFIDFTRGIAAVVVLLSHAGAAAGYFSKYGFGYSWLNLGQVGIIAFFAVSGFVIPLSIEHAKNMSSFAIRRIFRIYPLFLMMLCVTIFLQAFGIEYPFAIDGSTLKTVISNIFFASDYIGFQNLVGGSWTLSIEVVWYIAFAFAFALGLHKRPFLLALMISIFFFSIGAFSVFSGVRLPLGRLGMLGVCLVGYYFYKLYSKQIGRGQALAFITLLLVSILYLLWVSFSYHKAEGTTFRCVFISWLTGLLIFFIPFNFRQHDVFSHPLFLSLGRYSYSIYLIHPLVLFFCVQYFEIRAVEFISMIIYSLALSVVTYKLVEAPGVSSGKKLDKFVSNQKRKWVL